MINIFILYMPPGNTEAMIHYDETIKCKVSLERISSFLDHNLKSKLRNIFGNISIAVWGSRNSSVNRSKFERMHPGDDILIVEGNQIKLLGKVAEKTINPDLSRELWKNIRIGTNDGWDLIYFIANPLEINLPFSDFCKLFGYSSNYQLRGLTIVAEERITAFYEKYDDLYSVLQRIKLGEIIEEKSDKIDNEISDDNLLKDDFNEGEDKEISDHILIQWKLIRLGLKAGTKIWIPKNDQVKIVKEYNFSDFEKEFTAGIDIPAKYVENIDVVWKEQFRVDAAFEIENTTAIYSGLLRFSDLKIIAPNSNYPLFVVAPQSRYNRLVEQIKRPTFQKLNFHNKVRYLSYESVNEIDKFFANSNLGLNVDLLVGRSEIIR